MSKVLDMINDYRGGYDIENMPAFLEEVEKEIIEGQKAKQCLNKIYDLFDNRDANYSVYRIKTLQQFTAIVKRRCVDMEILNMSILLSDASNEDKCNFYNKEYKKKYSKAPSWYFINQKEFNILKEVYLTDDYLLF